jgi:CheY-like chemotaxis protein
MTKKEQLKEIDVKIGNKLKYFREKKFSSLKNFAGLADVPYQQIQKYESGENRIPASILYLLASILEIDANALFSEVQFRGLNKQKEQELNIIIVEDNEIDLMLIEKSFKDFNKHIKLRTFSNGLKALNYFSTLPWNSLPDIIFLDLYIQGKNGFQLLEFLQSMKKFDSSKKIMLTNSINKNDRDKAYRLGANSFLTKAFNVNDFQIEIKESLQYWQNIITNNQLAP